MAASAFLLSSVILAAGLAFTPGGASAQSVSEVVRHWGETLPIDGRVVGEIERFAADEKKEFEQGYSLELAEGVRKLIFKDIARQLERLEGGSREPLISVRVLDPGFTAGTGGASAGKAVEKFERSFVRTEVVAFFDNPDVTPEAALRLYVDAEFRKDVSSRIKEIRKEGNETCLEMEGVKILLSPIKYCSVIDELHRPELSIQHSQAVSNDDDERFQPVYFKESLKAFIAVPGGLALYYINYSRTIGMGGLQKKIARGKLEDSQRDAIEMLSERLNSDDRK